jgi:hypothetical protein
MTLRARIDHNDAPTRSAQAPDDGSGEGDALREEGEAFLAAADDAITRALSGDSERFLAQSRQLGGQ